MKKMIAFLTMFSMLMPMNINVMAVENNLSDKDDYIIMCATKKDAEKLADKYDSMEDAESIVLDNTVYNAELTLDEANKIENDKLTVCVEENANVVGATSDNDTEKEISNVEWNLKAIDANDVQQNMTNKVKVAIIDSGIDYSDDIEVYRRKNFIPGEDEVSLLYEDETGHGTSVAGIIAAKNNEIGITGINENVELYSAKVLDEENKAPVSRIIEAIEWAIEQDVNIINMSFGTVTESKALKQEIQKASDAGILLIASAGNAGVVEYPAAFDDVIAVGSIGADGEVSEKNGFGETLELYAPGEQILSTAAFGGVIVSGGTSMSAPHVTGVASVLWQMNLDVSAEFIRELMRSSVKSVNGETKYGYGVVNLENAIDMYDEFRSEFEMNSDINAYQCLEKETCVDTFDDVTYVEGRWSTDDHAACADGGNITGTDLLVLKRGARLPDWELCGLKGMSNYPQLHGYYPSNYIASYIMLTKMAKAYRDGNYADPANINGLSASDYSVLCNIVGSGINGCSWSSVLGSYAVNNRNKSLIVYGMALHTATDTFAHSSFTSAGTAITHDEADDTSYYKNRYTCAQTVASNMLVHCYNGTQGNVSDFAVGSSAYSFRIKYYSTYANSTNSSKYLASQSAFDSININ
jgi:minor extracellular protease Epr